MKGRKKGERVGGGRGRIDTGREAEDRQRERRGGEDQQSRQDDGDGKNKRRKWLRKRGKEN